MELKIVHFYPDLMSLYGSYANVSVLRRCLEVLGCAVTVQSVGPGEGADIAGADFLFMGAGTERAERFAAGDFARFGPAVKSVAEEGCAMLFAGTAMELLGGSVTDKDGETFDGIGLACFTTVQGGRRIVGDVYGAADLFPEAVVGFMNKCGLVRGVETPLLTGLALGFGNEAEQGPEGFHWKNVFASELTGPLLVKNPWLLDAVAAAIFGRRGVALPEDLPSFPYAEAGYAITAEQLRLRAEGKAFWDLILPGGLPWAVLLFFSAVVRPGWFPGSGHQNQRGSAFGLSPLVIAIPYC